MNPATGFTSSFLLSQCFVNQSSWAQQFYSSSSSSSSSSTAYKEFLNKLFGFCFLSVCVCVCVCVFVCASSSPPQEPSPLSFVVIVHSPYLSLT
jgi:hypothetical protein